MDELKRKFILAILSIILGQSALHPLSGASGVGDAQPLPTPIQSQATGWVARIGDETERALGRIANVMWDYVRSSDEQAAAAARSTPSAPTGDAVASLLWPSFLSSENVERYIREGRFDPPGQTLNYTPTMISMAPTPSATPTAAPAAPMQPVIPILEWVDDNGDGTYTAFFGYDNKNAAAVLIPVGPENSFAPTPLDRHQPTVFQPGRTPPYPDCPLKVVFRGEMLRWSLKGETATAIVLSH